MANRLKVQEQEAIKNLAALGWGIRKIARELECPGIAGHLIEPFRQQEGAVGLAGQSADVIGDFPHHYPGFRGDGAQDRFSRQQVLESNGGGVGGKAKRPADETVGHDDLIGFFHAQDASPARRSPDQPVRSGRLQIFRRS